jgi:hypothetical protein
MENKLAFIVIMRIGNRYLGVIHVVRTSILESVGILIIINNHHLRNLNLMEDGISLQ